MRFTFCSPSRPHTTDTSTVGDAPRATRGGQTFTSTFQDRARTGCVVRRPRVVGRACGWERWRAYKWPQSDTYICLFGKRCAPPPGGRRRRRRQRQSTAAAGRDICDPVGGAGGDGGLFGLRNSIKTLNGWQKAVPRALVIFNGPRKYRKQPRGKTIPAHTHTCASIHVCVMYVFRGCVCVWNGHTSALLRGLCIAGRRWSARSGGGGWRTNNHSSLILAPRYAPGKTCRCCWRATAGNEKRYACTGRTSFRINQCVCVAWAVHRELFSLYKFLYFFSLSLIFFLFIYVRRIMSLAQK
jgi:hypothetical protein